MDTGETNEDTYEDTYEEIDDVKNSAWERRQDLIERAPKYDGNSETVFEWCKNLENHLLTTDGKQS